VQQGFVEDFQQHSGRDLQQFDFKYQCGVWRYDATGSPGAVAQFRRDHESPHAADLHALDALVPARDDEMTKAQSSGKLKGLLRSLLESNLVPSSSQPV
jgi:hypothetical protein